MKPLIKPLKPLNMVSVRGTNRKMVFLFQVMALAEAAEENRALLEQAFVRLRSATHLLVLLLSLWQGLTPHQTAILEATLLPLLQDTPQLVHMCTHTHVDVY